MQISLLTNYLYKTQPSWAIFDLSFFQFPNIQCSLNKQMTLIDNNVYHLLIFTSLIFSKTRKKE